MFHGCRIFTFWDSLPNSRYATSLVNRHDHFSNSGHDTVGSLELLIVFGHSLSIHRLAEVEGAKQSHSQGIDVGLLEVGLLGRAQFRGSIVGRCSDLAHSMSWPAFV